MQEAGHNNEAGAVQKVLRLLAGHREITVLGKYREVQKERNVSFQLLVTLAHVFFVNRLCAQHLMQPFLGGLFYQ